MDHQLLVVMVRLVKILVAVVTGGTEERVVQFSVMQERVVQTLVVLIQLHLKI